MTVKEIMKELEAMGNPGTKKVLLKHGIQEPFFGVKVQDLKTIQKKVKKDHDLSLGLFATGNADAMYLAGLIADEKKINKKELTTWVKQAVSTNINTYTVPWITAESNFGMELALEWIDAQQEYIAAAGWSTLSSLIAIKPDNELDITTLKKLLTRVQKDIHNSPNRVRSTMNSFVIALGSFVPALTDLAIMTAKKIGDVMVDVGDTSCKVPSAIEYIQKVKDKGSLGKKKKMARC